MSSDDELRDHIHVLPPVSVGGHAVALEIEVGEVWVDGTIVRQAQWMNPRTLEEHEYAALVLKALRKVTELLQGGST